MPQDKQRAQSALSWRRDGQAVHVMFPIIGYEKDEHGEPIRDDEGELQFIYGDACFQVRVDTFVDEPEILSEQP